jgi:hypothetical protein
VTPPAATENRNCGIASERGQTEKQEDVWHTCAMQRARLAPYTEKVYRVNGHFFGISGSSQAIPQPLHKRLAPLLYSLGDEVVEGHASAHWHCLFDNATSSTEQQHNLQRMSHIGNACHRGRWATRASGVSTRIREFCRGREGPTCTGRLVCRVRPCSPCSCSAAAAARRRPLVSHAAAAACIRARSRCSEL